MKVFCVGDTFAYFFCFDQNIVQGYWKKYKLIGNPAAEAATSKCFWYAPLAAGNARQFWKQHSGCGVASAGEDLRNTLKTDLIKQHQFYDAEKARVELNYCYLETDQNEDENKITQQNDDDEEDEEESDNDDDNTRNTNRNKRKSRNQNKNKSKRKTELKQRRQSMIIIVKWMNYVICQMK